MADTDEPRDQRTSPQKIVSLKEDGYYSNCSMVEATPFDIAVLFGKIRPRTDERGQASLVEGYEKQIYLSHLQARALFEALGKSLEAMTRSASAQSAPLAPNRRAQPPTAAGAPRPATAPRPGSPGGTGGRPESTKP